ncbi:hypothetical protein XENTR_v10022600 [Xenopus tropicalis]|nr:hypothetical protein XENTR_v10022600 [Xenopus tropicalis]
MMVSLFPGIGYGLRGCFCRIGYGLGAVPAGLCLVQRNNHAAIMMVSLCPGIGCGLRAVSAGLCLVQRNNHAAIRMVSLFPGIGYGLGAVPAGLGMVWGLFLQDCV